MTKEAKEPTVNSLKADIKKILDTYYPGNNFDVIISTDKKTNKLLIVIVGVDFSEEFRKILNNFVSYKIKFVVRRKKEKEGNVVRYKRLFYEGFDISFYEKPGIKFYFKELLA